MIFVALFFYSFFHLHPKIKMIRTQKEADKLTIARLEERQQLSTTKTVMNEDMNSEVEASLNMGQELPPNQK